MSTFGSDPVIVALYVWLIYASLVGFVTCSAISLLTLAAVPTEFACLTIRNVVYNPLWLLFSGRWQWHRSEAKQWWTGASEPRSRFVLCWDLLKCSISQAFWTLVSNNLNQCYWLTTFVHFHRIKSGLVQLSHWSPEPYSLWVNAFLPAPECRVSC